MATPLHSVRVPEEVWAAAQERAALEGISVTAVVVRALERYGRGLVR
jgi:predicted HicB family RNase H-like nuclease